jgi:hypothetical protein
MNVKSFIRRGLVAIAAAGLVASAGLVSAGPASAATPLPTDVGANLDPGFFAPNGDAGRVIELGNFSDVTLSATVKVNGTVIVTVPVDSGAIQTALLPIPACASYTVQVDFGFPNLTLDTTEAPFGCPSATIDVSPNGDSLHVTNITSGDISFVVFAFTNNGNDVTSSPSPGTTSFTLHASEFVDIPVTVLPLPAGDTSYYFVLLPTLGDAEVAHTPLITGTVYVPPVILTAPSVSGVVARVGNRLPCAGATYSPNVNGVTTQWLRSGVLTSVTQSTYLLTVSDLGKRITCRVKATDGVTTVTASSAASAVVALGLAPKVVGTKVPKIVGTPTRGKYITVNQGVWTPRPSYFTCTLNRYVGSKIVRTLGPVKCTSTTKFKVPTKYAKGTKYFFTVRAYYKPGYAVGAKNTAVFKSR